MWRRTVGWLVALAHVLLRREPQQAPPVQVPEQRPAPPVLVSVGAPSTPAPRPQPAPGTAPTMSWSEAWSLAWRGELLEAPAVPAPPPPPPPSRPRRSHAWLASVLLAELQAGILLGAVYEVVKT